MSPERSQAYHRVLKTLHDIGPAKLQPDEQELIRTAADSLVLCFDLFADDAATAALDDAETLCRALVQRGRWQSTTAARLAADIRACGPEIEIEIELEAA